MRTPVNEYVFHELDRLLAPHVRDGSEANEALEDLIVAIENAHGDRARVRLALIEAKRRMRRLLADTVPRDVVTNAIAVLNGLR
jgi:hypothetical protein